MNAMPTYEKILYAILIALCALVLVLIAISPSTFMDIKAVYGKF